MKKYCRSSFDSSTISVAKMELVLDSLKSQQVRPSTLKNYMAVWREFNKFLLRLDDCSRVNTWEKRLVIYGTYLVEQGAQSQTIKSYFSAIKFILKSDGYTWNDDEAQLKVITKSCEIINDRIKIRLPIRVHLLEQILFEEQRKFTTQPFIQSMYKTLFCTAYYGMMRIGELVKAESEHFVRAKDVHLSPNQDKIMLRLHTSKTHVQGDKPQEIKISKTQVLEVQRFFCPFKLMREYISYRGIGFEEYSKAFFIYHDGSPVLADTVRTTLRQLLDNLNLDSSLYDTMSFRSGRVVDMYKMGYSLESLKRIGRWKSDAIYHYIKL